MGPASRPTSTGPIYLLGVLALAAGTIVMLAAASSPIGEAKPSVSSPDTSIAAQRLLVRGMTEMQLGDTEEAIDYFERALDHVPQSSTVLQALADAHATRGEYTTALFYARQARTHGANRAYYHRRLAELQQEAGASNDAIETYRTLLRRFPDEADAYRALAQLQATLDRPRAALATYEALQKRLSPLRVSDYQHMLSLYEMLEDHEGVRTTLETLVDRRPSSPEYRRRLAAHYASHDRPNVAIDLLEPLLQKRPKDSDVRARLRTLYRTTGRSEALSSLDDRQSPLDTAQSSTDRLLRRARLLLETPTPGGTDSTRLREAEQLAAQIRQRAPERVEVHLLDADIQKVQGDLNAAGRAYERALEANPRSAERWTRAVRTYLQAGYPERATAVAEEGLLLFPGHPPLIRTAAEAFLRAQHAERALEQFQKALTLRDSTDASRAAALRAGVGRAYTALDQPEEAESAFQTALTQSPDHPIVLSSYAYSLAHREQELDRALQLAERAVEEAPNRALHRHTLGWVHFQMGHTEAAATQLRNALEMGPPSVSLLDHFGDVQAALGNDAAARRYWQRALDRAPSRAAIERKLESDPGT